jgi:hypothetical protein
MKGDTMISDVKKKIVNQAGRDGLERVTFTLGAVKKRQLDMIIEQTGIDYSSICRYAIDLIVEQYLNNALDLKKILMYKETIGRKRVI